MCTLPKREKYCFFSFSFWPSKHLYEALEESHYSHHQLLPRFIPSRIGKTRGLRIYILLVPSRCDRGRVICCLWVQPLFKPYFLSWGRQGYALGEVSWPRPLVLLVVEQCWLILTKVMGCPPVQVSDGPRTGLGSWGGELMCLLELAFRYSCRLPLPDATTNPSVYLGCNKNLRIVLFRQNGFPLF